MRMLEPVPDRSAKIVEVSFFDELNAPVVPQNVTWSLVDGSGNTINTKKDVSIAAAETVYIPTHGADNAFISGGSQADNTRTLVVKATYLSALTGTILPNNQARKYMILDLPAD